MVSLVLAHATLLAIFDLGDRPHLTLPVLAFAFAAYLWAVRRLEHRLTAPAILLVAAGLRLLLIPLPPTLSDDTLRYVWDGRVLLAGHDPYSFAPEAPELAPLRDDLWREMPHHQVPTVYPPLALAFFTVANLLPRPLIAIKILLCLAELLGCLLLIRLARTLGHPPGRAAWYCWSPLATLEVAGMGHVDGLMVAATIGAVLLLASTPRRPVAAGVAAAAGVLAKLVPLFALPAWSRCGGRPLRFLAAAGAVMAVGFLPVAVATGGVPPGLVTYGVSWEFNGPLFEPLSFLVDRAGAVPAVKAGLDELKGLTGRHDFWNRFYPFVYPELLAKLVLAAAFGAVVLASVFGYGVLGRDISGHDRGWRHPVVATGRLFGALLLCSATFYPWYLLWVLPWAALCRHRAWLALSVSIQLSYLSQTTEVPHLPWIFLLIWLPFFLLLSRSRWSID